MSVSARGKMRNLWGVQAAPLVGHSGVDAGEGLTSKMSVSASISIPFRHDPAAVEFDHLTSFHMGLLHEPIIL